MVAERRSARRFKMQLPLTVRWTGESGVDAVLTETNDVSSRGVSFSMLEEVQLGSVVEIVMCLPQPIVWTGSVRVRFLGRVLRVTRQGKGKAVVTAAIERYEFLREEKAAV